MGFLLPNVKPLEDTFKYGDSVSFCKVIENNYIIGE